MADAPHTATAATAVPDATVQAGPSSPLSGILAIVAAIVSALAVFDALGRAMGVVLAAVAILLALVALLECVIPRDRGGRIAVITVPMAVVSDGVSGVRLSGRSVLGHTLPADDIRSLKHAAAPLPSSPAHDGLHDSSTTMPAS